MTHVTDRRDARLDASEITAWVDALPKCILFRIRHESSIAHADWPMAPWFDVNIEKKLKACLVQYMMRHQDLNADMQYMMDQITQRVFHLRDAMAMYRSMRTPGGGIYGQNDMQLFMDIYADLCRGGNNME